MTKPCKTCGGTKRYAPANPDHRLGKCVACDRARALRRLDRIKPDRKRYKQNATTQGSLESAANDRPL